MELLSRKTRFAAFRFGWFSRQSWRSFITEGFLALFLDGNSFFLKSIVQRY
jgi:hypothetical protein